MRKLALWATNGSNVPVSGPSDVPGLKFKFSTVDGCFHKLEREFLTYKPTWYPQQRSFIVQAMPAAGGGADITPEAPSLLRAPPGTAKSE